METVVSVRHERSDGFHVFTSPEVPGLYLLGPDNDYQGLESTIPEAIINLAEADQRKPFRVRRVWPYSSEISSDTAGKATFLYYILVDD